MVKRFVILVLVLLPLSYVWGLQDQSIVLGTEQEAVDTAIAYTGLDRLEGVKLSAKLVTVSDDNTPFLSDQINGKLLWLVTAAGFELTLYSSKGAEVKREKYVTDLEILIDPVSAKLLKVSSRWPSDEPPIAPLADATETERQLKAHRKSFDGFPDDRPKVDLLKAMDTVGGPVLAAKQIIVHYVLHTNLRWKRKPVWIIHLRGTPPAPEVGIAAMYAPDPVPAGLKGLEWRTVIIDPGTGRRLAGTSDRG